MNWDQRRNPIELFVEWAAPALLASAVGWAARALTGNPLVVALSLATVAFVGFALMRRVTPEAGHALADFELMPFENDAAEELLLDDPLVPIADGSRVVRLFDRQPNSPGEMIARINDFLELGPQLSAADVEADRMHRPSDASAAMHEALANIRASLR